SPTTDPGVFDLFIDGTQFATNVGNNGDTGVQTVLAGNNHIVAETAGTGTLLSDYSPITVTCVDAVTQAPVASGVGPILPNITVAPNQHVLCMFTNTRGQGRLRVMKTLDPAGDGGLFNLTIDGTVDAADVGNNGDTGFVSVD